MSDTIWVTAEQKRALIESRDKYLTDQETLEAATDMEHGVEHDYRPRALCQIHPVLYMNSGDGKQCPSWQDNVRACSNTPLWYWWDCETVEEQRWVNALEYAYLWELNTRCKVRGER